MNKPFNPNFKRDKANPHGLKAGDRIGVLTNERSAVIRKVGSGEFAGLLSVQYEDDKSHDIVKIYDTAKLDAQ